MKSSYRCQSRGRAQSLACSLSISRAEEGLSSRASNDPAPVARRFLLTVGLNVAAPLNPENLHLGRLLEVGQNLELAGLQFLVERAEPVRDRRQFAVVRRSGRCWPDRGYLALGAGQHQGHGCQGTCDSFHVRLLPGPTRTSMACRYLPQTVE